MATENLVDAEQFDPKSMRKLLKSWSRVDVLGNHPLAQTQMVAARRRAENYADSASGRGLALQQIVAEAVEALRPEAGPPDPTRKRWRAYIILKEQFLAGRSPGFLIEEMAIARRTFYNEQTTALERLASQLRQREALALSQREAADFADSTDASPPIFLAPPRPHHALVAREEALRALKARLLAGDSATCVLHGLPGVGKTALVTELAHDAELLAHFADGVLWAGLGQQPDATALLGRWGAALGLSTPDLAAHKSLEARLHAIHGAMGQRQLLLVIDDAWDEEMALRFRLGGPRCGYLITTRLPEVAQALAGDAPNAVQELDDASGLELLRMLAPAAVEAEPEAARRLVSAAGGLPLALTLIGKRLRTAQRGHSQRLVDALAQLQAADVRLDLQQPQTPVASHPSLPFAASLSLRSAIQISVAALPQPVQQSLHRLAILPPKPNSFSEATARALVGEPTALHALADAGLLEWIPPNRYTLHQTIADYARANLADFIPNGDEERASLNNHRRALVRHVLGFATSHAEPAAYSQLEQETPNILAALDIARADDDPALLPLVQALHPFYESRGLYATMDRYGEAALEMAGARADRAAQIVLARQLGRTRAELGRYEEGEALLNQSLQMAREAGDDLAAAQALKDLSISALHRGRYQEANALLQEGLSLVAPAMRPTAKAAQENQAETISLAPLPISDLTSGILLSLGGANVYLGQYEKAQAYLEQALHQARRLGNSMCAAGALLSLGVVNRHRGDLAEAERYYQESAALARAAGHRERIIGALTNLTALCTKRGQYAQAQGHAAEALQIAEQMGAPRAIAVQLINVATVAFHLGDYQAAEPQLQQGLALATRHGYTDLAIFAQANLGEIYTHYGSYAQATQHLEAGLALARQNQHRQSEGNLLDLLGAVELERGDWARGERLFAESLHIARELDYQERLGSVLVRQGILMERCGGDVERAIAQIEEGLAIAQAGGNRETLITARLALAELGRAGNGPVLVPEEITQNLSDALALARRISGGVFLVRALLGWGEWQLALGEQAEKGSEEVADVPDAKRAFDEAFAVAERTGCRAEAALARFGLARLAAERGEGETARSLGRRSCAALRALGHYRAGEVEAWLSSA